MTMMTVPLANVKQKLWIWPEVACNTGSGRLVGRLVEEFSHRTGGVVEYPARNQAQVEGEGQADGQGNP